MKVSQQFSWLISFRYKQYQLVPSDSRVTSRFLSVSYRQGASNGFWRFCYLRLQPLLDSFLSYGYLNELIYLDKY